MIVINSTYSRMDKPVTIFLADDDPDDRALFIDAVHEVDGDIKCLTASDGQQAMNFLTDSRNTVPDYIFLDLRMPRKGGRKCLEEIREDSRLKHIPVIIYTTSDDVEDSKDLTHHGATHFISKPTNPDEIYYLVSQVLNENLA